MDDWCPHARMEDWPQKPYRARERGLLPGGGRACVSPDDGHWVRCESERVGSTLEAFGVRSLVGASGLCWVVGPVRQRTGGRSGCQGAPLGSHPSDCVTAWRTASGRCVAANRTCFNAFVGVQGERPGWAVLERPVHVYHCYSLQWQSSTPLRNHSLSAGASTLPSWRRRLRHVRRL